MSLHRRLHSSSLSLYLTRFVNSFFPVTIQISNRGSSVHTHTLMQTNWEKKGWVEIFAYDQRVFHRQISKFYLRHWWWRWWCQPWISLCSPRSHIAQNFRVKYSHCLPAHAYQMKLNTPREWVRVFVRCCCFFFLIRRCKLHWQRLRLQEKRMSYLKSTQSSDAK